MGAITASQLIAFEEKIAEYFNSGKIKAPVHLYSGNESSLIDIFREIKPDDWVFCSWRSHYQCLLKGVPQTQLEKAILEGRSIALSFPEFKVYSSAIVGGQLPIAVGAAMSIKLRGVQDKVWCFLGDMTAETGMFQSCSRYALKHALPITFIIEDNNVSVMTDTRKVWNTQTLRFEETRSPNVITYKYHSKYPHAGAGVRVQF